MCECIKYMNSYLAKFNTEIELPLWTGNGKIVPFIQTVKINAAKRGKPHLVFAAYCPFCGKKYRKTQEIKNANANPTRRQKSIP